MVLKPLETEIIQGGMGVGVSDSPLAKEVSNQGGMGVISGVAREVIMTRRLQNGDVSGDIRRALKQYPDEEFAKWILDKYFIEGGKDPKARYEILPFPTFKSKFDSSIDKSLVMNKQNLTNLIIAANFVEVYLAKEGHSNPVGINYLYKVRYAVMPAIYGAMLAGVDAILIGAGFAKEIPDALTSILENRRANLSIPVIGDKDNMLLFEPDEILKHHDLQRPTFFGILGNHMGLRALPNADAYIFEGPTAGGHNAPARIKTLNERGEPDYGVKDDMDFGLLKMLLEQNAEKQQSGTHNSNTHNIQNIPSYWFAGGYANRLQEAKDHGAVGIQVGTPFAFSRESGVESILKQKILKQIMEGNTVFTSPDASSSGFPFKLFQSPDTITNPELYNARKRVCDLGFLVDLYRREDGRIGTRCPSEIVSAYIAKGGLEKDTVNKVCLCNGLPATVGLGSPGEIPIVTAGSDLSIVKILVEMYGLNYSVKNVMDFIRKDH